MELSKEFENSDSAVSARQHYDAIKKNGSLPSVF